MIAKGYIFILLCIVAFASCGDNITQGPVRRSASSDRNADLKAAQPIKIAIMLDKTRSATQTRTPQLGAEDLDGMINHITENGGEIGLGIVDDRSNEPLLRLFLEAAPVKDFTAPDPDQNPYMLIKQRQDYRSKLERYNQTMNSRRAQIGEDVKEFRGDAQSLLEKSPDASRSNIFTAIARADLFLAEQDAYQSTAKKYLLLVSDGQHNVVSVSPVHLKSSAKLILVNGAGSLGSLGCLDPVRFESIGAAIRYILADAQRERVVNDNAR